MRELTTEELGALGGSGVWTVCGIMVGITLGSSLLYGGVGFLLTANKAFVACTVPLVL